MWNLNINTPDSEPKMIKLKPGRISVGRLSTNDVVIEDISASRQHAEVVHDPSTGVVTITDLNSTNGTYVNRQRITGTYQLQDNDVVRIGQVVMHLTKSDEKKAQRGASGTHQFTRELLLESLDEHAILLYEVSRKLNTVVDIETAIGEVTALIKRSMGVDRCEVVLSKNFRNLSELGFPDPLALRAVQQHSAEVTPTAMYVPVLAGNETLGLICMIKDRPNSRPFDRRDLQLAIAISHQAALTIQRMFLLDRVRKQERVHQLLLRFLSPPEAEYILGDYLKTGQLPPLTEQKVTVMFADMADSVGLAERLGPQRFATILNAFYQDATEVVFKYGGMIKYLGDGVMAIFIQSGTGSVHEEKAVYAGRELVARVKKTGYLDLERKLIIGVSINTGRAMVGYVGTQDRAEFNVLGDTVNVAFRMQEHSRPYRVLVGPATIAAIIDKFQTRRVGSVTLKGREQPIQVYEVVAEL
jgi:adenylate cyclase